MTITGKINHGQIEHFEPLGLPDGTEVQIDVRPLLSDFWENLSADELIRRQQPQPIRNLDDLAGDWPAEDSLDEFLELVRKVRR